MSEVLEEGILIFKRKDEKKFLRFVPNFRTVFVVVILARRRFYLGFKEKLILGKLILDPDIFVRCQSKGCMSPA